jgi:hypothetical protein
MSVVSDAIGAIKLLTEAFTGSRARKDKTRDDRLLDCHVRRSTAPSRPPCPCSVVSRPMKGE